MSRLSGHDTGHRGSKTCVVSTCFYHRFWHCCAKLVGQLHPYYWDYLERSQIVDWLIELAVNLRTIEVVHRIVAIFSWILQTLFNCNLKKSDQLHRSFDCSCLTELKGQDPKEPYVQLVVTCHKLNKLEVLFLKHVSLGETDPKNLEQRTSWKLQLSGGCE